MRQYVERLVRIIDITLILSVLITVTMIMNIEQVHALSEHGEQFSLP